MVKTQVSFFHLVGSLIGGCILIGITAVYGITLLNIVVDLNTCMDRFYIPNFTGVPMSFFFIALSMMSGNLLSYCSVHQYHDKGLKKHTASKMADSLIERTGCLEDSLSIRNRSIRGLEAKYRAFAHNSGHPNNLYDRAGRARLMGSTAFLLYYNSMLSVATNAILLAYRGDEYNHTMGYALLLFSAGSLALGLYAARAAVAEWSRYHEMICFFAVFQFKDNDLYEPLGVSNKIIQIP